MAKKVGNEKPMVKDESKPGREEAIKALQQDQKERTDACGQAIREALEKYSCQLGAVAFIDPKTGTVGAEPRLYPK